MDEAYLEVERTKGAGLPHRDADPIMRLSAHYYEPADFMHEQFRKLDRQAATPKGLSRAKVMERRYYLMHWLSGLYVTIEGMETLPLSDELASRPLDIPELCDYVIQILADVDDYRDSLRLLRNATFHFQWSADKHIQFFDNRIRLRWAEHLHMHIGDIFRQYRVRCAVVCAVSGRTDEIDMKRTISHPSRNMVYLP